MEDHEVDIVEMIDIEIFKDEYVSMKVLVEICNVLECNIGDIVDIVKDK